MGKLDRWLRGFNQLKKFSEEMISEETKARSEDSYQCKAFSTKDFTKEIKALLKTPDLHVDSHDEKSTDVPPFPSKVSDLQTDFPSIEEVDNSLDAESDAVEGGEINA